MGWHGVVVGSSTLKDAEAKLGQGKLLRDQNGLKNYEFGKGVAMTVSAGDYKVREITVTDAVCPDPEFPIDRKDAERRYQQLHSDAFGVKTTFSKSPEPKLQKLQFYEPKIEDDTRIDPRRVYHHPH